MNSKQAYVLARSYTDDSIAGTTGALAGKNCTISSATHEDGVTTIVFKWTADDGTSKTSSIQVKDGETPTISVTSITGGHKVTFTTTDPAQSYSINILDGVDGQDGQDGDDGVSVVGATIDENKHLKLTLSDGNEIDCGEIVTAVELDELEDVNLSTLADGEVLTYNGTSGKWENKELNIKANISDLEDVSITGTVTNGSILRYDTTTRKWVNDTIPKIESLGDIEDVTLTSPVDGQILTFDGTNWKNKDNKVVDLKDINISNPQNGQILVYDSVSGKWKNGSPSATSTSVADLADVSLNNLEDGQVLVYDAANNVWKNKNGGSTTIDELGDISDVDLTNLSDGQVIAWDATNSKWVNVNLPTVPTKTSELTNDSNFITKAVNDLVNYYLKSETYDKTEVDQLIAAVKNSRFEVVATLPTTDIKTNVIYLVPKSTAQTSNVKDEYINLDGTSAGWEKIGDTEIDLSDYVTTQALNTALADYTTTADLTTLLAAKADKSTVDGILDGTNIDSFADVETALADYQTKNLTSTIEGETTVEGALGALSENKQDSLTFDNVPTENSNNPVKSGGVYSTNDKIYQVMGQNSAKNFIPFDLDKIKAKNTTGTWNGNVYSVNGIDFTFNSDGTVDASGTATETASVHYYDPVGLPPFGGDRILRLTGCPSGGSGTTYKVMAYRAGEVDGSTGTAEEYGDGISLRWLNNGSGIKAFISISVYTGAGTIDLTFKPMLCLSIDTDNTFAPYAKTNQQLTQENQTLTNQVKDMNNVYGAKNVLDLTPRLKKNVSATYITSVSNDGIVLNGTVGSSTTLRINPAEDDNSFVLPQGTYVLSHKDGPSPSGASITLRKNGTNLTTSNRLANPYEFEANGTDYFTVLIHVDAVTFNNAVVCPMICLKSFYELDTSFEPYAKTNQELTQDTTALLDNLEVNGAVNMLPNTATTQTINGVTFTVNASGTIDVSGTATANANLAIGSFNVKAGTQYTISDGIGTLEHDNVAGVMYAISVPAQGEAAWYWRTDYIGAPVDRRTAIANYDAVVTAYIRIPSGATVNYKFKPMFTLASYNGDYVPYAKTNRELTEIVDADHNIVKTIYPTMNIYWTDNAYPSDFDNLTTQQATDIAQALYDVFKKIGGAGGIRYSGLITVYDRKASDGSQLSSSRDMVDIYSNASYDSMLSNNSNARFTLVRHPYGSAMQITYALWQNKLMYSNHGINNAGTVTDRDKLYNYNTISTYKG